ncbi:MAG: ornithine cyclodeaminase family protein [Erysipelotrichaceae bacterium]|nr:ornithine cyclodeaminase family protein [Erysipelotrichaceae bacterium]
MSMELRYLSSEEVLQKLEMPVCITLMRDVFRAFAEGRLENKIRSVLPVEPGRLLGIMPGLISYEEAVGAKLITVFHDNYKKHLPSHQGIVAVFSTEDGTLKGICDGTAITAVRTGAVSAVATDLLARKDAHTLALFGGGVQADMHLKSLTCVRGIDTVYIWCPTLAESEAFAEAHKEQYPNIEFIPCVQGEDAAKNADIICTVTPSHTPVLKGEWVKKGTHINAVGACAAKDRELDSACTVQSRFFCDSRGSCMAESGDFLFPVQEGLVTENHLLGELADLVSGRVQGRQNDEDITVFEALGLAAEDLACAAWLLKE